MTFSISSPTLIADLWAFKREGSMPPGASTEHLVMYAGRDDLHGSLKAAISSCRSSLLLSMYGMDDPELWDIVWGKVNDPSVLTLITLDKTQAGGVAEAKILKPDESLAVFNSHVVIGQSATHEINHTKAGVIDGILAWHGSANWSATGEGEGTKAQNNTMAWFTDRLNVNSLRDQLSKEHIAAEPKSA